MFIVDELELLSLFLTEFYIDCINLCITFGKTFLQPINLFTFILIFHTISRSIFLASICFTIYPKGYKPCDC